MNEALERTIVSELVYKELRNLFNDVLEITATFAINGYNLIDNKITLDTTLNVYLIKTEESYRAVVLTRIHDEHCPSTHKYVEEKLTDNDYIDELCTYIEYALNLPNMYKISFWLDNVKTDIDNIDDASSIINHFIKYRVQRYIKRGF